MKNTQSLSTKKSEPELVDAYMTGLKHSMKDVVETLRMEGGWRCFLGWRMCVRRKPRCGG